MKNTNVSTIIILLLILLNSVTLGIMWFGKPPCPPQPPIPMEAPHPPHPPHEPGGPGAFLMEELKFDDKQKAEFEKLKQAHRQSARALQDSMHVLKEKLFDGIPGGDMTLADKNASEIAALQKRLELVTFEHFKQVRALCNDEQKKTFDSIIGDVLKMMAPPPPRPPRH